MRTSGDKMKDITIIEKILRSMTLKFKHVVCSIEESKDLDALSIEELMSSLRVHEQRINQHVAVEQALQLQYSANNQSFQKKGYGQGRRRSNSSNNDHSTHGNQVHDPKDVKRYGHYRFEYRTKLYQERGAKSNFAEKEEEVSLLMACNITEDTHKRMWYLDTGSSLKTNLLSVVQLQEKGYEIIIKEGTCIIQDPKMGLITQVNMTANRMFPLYIQNDILSCFSAMVKDLAWLWHFHYEHLNFSGLKLLHQKNMVTGFPQIDHP
ncbi:uncharacterized protein LOC114266596 [Camellia sinensis]|uniref:uncharacterized protein LOC114266596 n=1 Tax=Camellia sinensis TaxID=4442 RepID=UPI001036AC21|nr:uncharacterized protein LOC114266596 [Camellia sinensis]